MDSLSRLSVILLLSLLPAALAAQPASVDSGLVEEEIPVIEFSVDRKDSTSGKQEKKADPAPEGTPGREPAAPGTAASPGVVPPPQARPRLRRVMISLGGGEEPIRDLKEPPFPAGKDAPYDWDTRFLVRLNGVSLRLQLHNRLGFKQFALNGHLRVDPFVRSGLGHARDEVFDWAKRTKPLDKQGFLLGFQATKSDYWGFSADYDKVDVLTEDGQVLDLVTSVGAGYSPLGLNKGKRWNYALNASINYEDLRESLPITGRTHQSGFGYGLGPVFQYGLDWVPIPGFSKRYRVRNKIKLERVRVRATYGESKIRHANVYAGVDVVGYATRWVRLTAGVDQVFAPGSGKGQLDQKVRLDVIIHFVALKW